MVLRVMKGILKSLLVVAACVAAWPAGASDSLSAAREAETDVIADSSRRASTALALLTQEIKWESPRSESGSERRLFSSGPRYPKIIGHYWIEDEEGRGYALMMGQYGEWWVAQITRAAENELTDRIAGESFTACWEIVKRKYGFAGEIAEPKLLGDCAWQ